MNPIDILNGVSAFNGGKSHVICDLHSACGSFSGGKRLLCGNYGSNHPVIDFDAVKAKYDKSHGSATKRKSADAITVSPSNKYLCFIELKSWLLLLQNNGTVVTVRKQATKYESDLPQKLSDSLFICEDIMNDHTIFNDCDIIFIMVSDIFTNNSLGSLVSNLNALAGTSSNLSNLCIQLSQGIMKKIPKVQTYYWQCHDFDAEISKL